MYEGARALQPHLAQRAGAIDLHAETQIASGCLGVGELCLVTAASGGHGQVRTVRAGQTVCRERARASPPRPMPISPSTRAAAPPTTPFPVPGPPVAMAKLSPPLTRDPGRRSRRQSNRTVRAGWITTVLELNRVPVPSGSREAWPRRTAAIGMKESSDNFAVTLIEVSNSDI
jgi:hypothetical protein